MRRLFGAGVGLLAGLILAITPIGVAMDRDNMPDTAMVLALLLAAWALARAAETGRLGPLLLSAALVGVGFETKMLAAFVVVPTSCAVYLLAAPTGLRRKLAHLAVASAVLVATSPAWPIAVELTPKDCRPYIGGSTRNSALELALGHNGLARIMGMGGLGPRPALAAAAVLLWSGWFATHWLVFSFAGGIIHVEPTHTLRHGFCSTRLTCLFHLMATAVE